jgi:hypothetical protein
MAARLQQCVTARGKAKTLLLVQYQFGSRQLRMSSPDIVTVASAADAWKKFVENRCKMAINLGASLEYVFYSAAADEITKEPIPPEVASALIDFASHENHYHPDRQKATVTLLALMKPFVRSATWRIPD